MSYVSEQARLFEESLRRAQKEAMFAKQTDDALRYAWAQQQAAAQQAYAYQQYGFATPPVVPATDPYSVLGLPRSATRQEVNRRHRQLAREYRDDADKLKVLNNAFNAVKVRSVT